jgi:hypothetical protein
MEVVVAHYEAVTLMKGPIIQTWGPQFEAKPSRMLTIK